MQAGQVLHNVLQQTCAPMHKTRRDALSAVVMAALREQTLTVTGLGRAIDSDAKEKHCIKRADRLLSNVHLQACYTDVYQFLAQQLIGAQTRPVIIVDWSDMDPCKRHFLLRASVPVQGRSHTLYEQVHTIKTKEKRRTHRQFLAILHRLVPEDCQPIVVTDAGFRTPWFQQVEALGWDWVGRVRNRTFIALDGQPFAPGKSLYAGATATPKALGDALMTRSNPIACRLVRYKGKRQGRVHHNRFGEPARSHHSRKHARSHREPWLLATSLPHRSTLAKRVVELYRTRMHIEEAFRDLKSARFGLGFEWHVARRVERLQVLLLIATLALFVAWLLGKVIELSQQQRHYQANTIRSRTVLSTIFLGLRVVNDKRATITAHQVHDAYDALRCIIDSHCDPFRVETNFIQRSKCPT